MDTQLMEEHVSKEVCDTRYQTLCGKIDGLGVSINKVLRVVEGNGKPGLRATQQDVETLKEIMRDERAARNTREQSSSEWLKIVVRTALPYVFMAAMFLVYLTVQGIWGD